MPKDETDQILDENDDSREKFIASYNHLEHPRKPLTLDEFIQYMKHNLDQYKRDCTPEKNELESYKPNFVHWMKDFQNWMSF